MKFVDFVSKIFDRKILFLSKKDFQFDIYNHVRYKLNIDSIIRSNSKKWSNSGSPERVSS
jgi:hypothetical protein